jgi:hypothetical protein
VSIEAAFAWIHRTYHHKGARIINGSVDACYSYRSVLDRLSQNLTAVLVEFGEFVKEENTVVCERDFTGARVGSAADKCRRGKRVVGRSERSVGKKGSEFTV